MPYDDKPGLEELFVGVYQKCDGVALVVLLDARLAWSSADHSNLNAPDGASVSRLGECEGRLRRGWPDSHAVALAPPERERPMGRR